MSFTDKKTAELRKIAEERGLKNFAALNRKQLLAALESEPEAESGETPENESSPEEKPEKAESEDPESEEEAEEPAPAPAPVARVANSGVKEGHFQPGSKAEKMKAALALQPKMSIMIPLASGEKSGRGITESVILNGYRLNIQKGVYVEVPKQVGEIIMESQRQTQMATDIAQKLDGDERALK